MTRFVVMGVSGCGKTTVGGAVAERIQARFIDGDDLHPPTNIAKMSRGEPLSDADRHPWLVKVGQELAGATKPVVIGCSALKRKYRDTIRSEAAGPVVFLHLAGSREVLKERMNTREGHFMPASLLDSQFAALEPPQDDERAITVDIDQPFEQLVNELVNKIERIAS